MLHGIEHLLHSYGYGVITIVILLESMGAPLPGESLLIATGVFAAASGKLNIGIVVASAALGAILGDNAGYLIGHSLGYRLLARYGRRIGLTEPRLRLGQYLFRRHGGKVVFFGRFIVVLRSFAALLAGANRMEWRSFLFYNALGGICWCALYGFGAYVLGDAAKRLSGPLGLAIGTVAATVVGATVLMLKRKERRLTREAERAMQREGSG